MLAIPGQSYRDGYGSWLDNSPERSRSSLLKLSRAHTRPMRDAPRRCAGDRGVKQHAEMCPFQSLRGLGLHCDSAAAARPSRAHHSWPHARVCCLCYPLHAAEKGPLVQMNMHGRPGLDTNQWSQLLLQCLRRCHAQICCFCRLHWLAPILLTCWHEPPCLSHICNVQVPIARQGQFLPNTVRLIWDAGTFWPVLA